MGPAVEERPQLPSDPAYLAASPAPRSRSSRDCPSSFNSTTLPRDFRKSVKFLYPRTDSWKVGSIRSIWFLTDELVIQSSSLVWPSSSALRSRLVAARWSAGLAAARGVVPTPDAVLAFALRFRPGLAPV